jgi:hypothetical protein
MTASGSSFLSKGLVAAAVLALANTPAAQQTGQATAQETSTAFDQACIDLINGKTPRGAQAIDALQEACAELMKARTDDRRRAEQQRQALAEQARQAQAQAQAQAQPGAKQTSQETQSTAPVEAGESALAAFVQAGNEMVGGAPRGMTGMRRSGLPFNTTVITNPVGWFNGLGVNAEVLRSFLPAFSWAAGAHYSQSAATDSTLYTLGVLGGADWFILGRNNEGLRVGPRLDLSFGREDSTDTDTRGRLGLAGELGYNFIATNGISGQAAFGVGGRVAGDKNDELSSAAGGEFGPYVKLGVGFSW